MHLILLPGLDGTGDLFAGLLAVLPPSFEPAVISYPADEPLGYAALEQIVRSRLPQDKPYVLLAESFSGPIAISIASSPPPGLRGLVLCCSFARSPWPWLSSLRFLSRAAPRGLLSSWLARRTLLGRFGCSRLHAEVRGTIRRVSPSVLRERLSAVSVVDVRERLREVCVPVVYLRASADRLVPRAAVEEIMALKPEVHVLTIEGPHLLLQARPEECARRILKSIAAL